MGENTAPAAAPIERIEALEALDGLAGAVGANARKQLSGPRLKALLRGDWLGHAVHPLLTDLVIGSFTSATVLDLVGGRRSRPASEVLIGVGIAAYPPTAVTGVSDWSDEEQSQPQVRRVGLVHAATNAVGLSAYGVSLVARRRGDHAKGVLLGLAGAAALAAAGLLGGHLTYVQRVGLGERSPRSS